MKAFAVLALAGILAVLCACSNSSTQQAAPARSHSVQQLLLSGEAETSATGVTVTEGTTVQHTLSKGENIPDGTRIDVPANLVVVVESTGGKSTVTLDPGSSLTFVSTGAGEVIARNAGNATFSVVPGSLDFFKVQAGDALTASVHGTIFSVQGTGGDVTFSCARGTVDIVKNGYVQVGTDSYPTTLVDVITPTHTPKVTYHPTHTWYIAKFSNFSQAETFYQQQAAIAQRSGDAHAVEIARLNLGNVHHVRIHAAILRLRRMPAQARASFLRAHPGLRRRIETYHRRMHEEHHGQPPGRHGTSRLQHPQLRREHFLRQGTTSGTRFRRVAYAHPTPRTTARRCPRLHPHCCPPNHPHCLRR